MLRISLITIFLLHATLSWASAPIHYSDKHRVATQIITGYIENNHYKKVVLDDALSKKIWKRYIDSLDPNHNVFLRSDVDEFSEYKTKIDDALIRSDLRPAFEMFYRYEKRLNDRVTYAIKRLKHKYNFNIDEEYVFDREGKPWPKDMKALDGIWSKRVKNDILSLKLAGKKNKEINSTLRKRYERMIRNVQQWKNDDVYQIFINAFTQSIEPHTAYFSPRTSENFKINMSLSLEGIGAQLRSDNEYTVVQKTIKGGPADLSGQLKPEDKIVGVGQGKRGKIVDVVGSRLSDVVDYIRGPKDSIVRLQLLTKGTGPEGPFKIITLVRNKIRLEEQAAKSSILKVNKGGKSLRIGVIDVPTFYMDFEGRARGEKNFRSTTRDVKALLANLMVKHIDGLIIDLRGNGGGSLYEATDLTGIFIKSGPVVQIKQASGEIKINEDPSPDSFYDGPLVVLVDRYSASASEIFAGAIQDYRRGIIVGEPTFGKGTVQTLIPLDHRVDPSYSPLDQLKITSAQFFRVNGDSTQFRGVVPDIVFPTSVDSHKHGERGLDNALPWAHIRPAKYTMDHLREDLLHKVKNRYLERSHNDPRFQLLQKQSKKHLEALNRISVSLLESRRKKEKDELEKEQKVSDREFKLAIGLDPDEKVKKKTKDNNEDDDFVSRFLLKETAEILSDYILSARQRTIVHQLQHGDLPILD